MRRPAAPEDDRYPCSPRHTVEVRVFSEYQGGWRVAVWGADDAGLECTFATEAEQKALCGACPPRSARSG